MTETQLHIETLRAQLRALMESYIQNIPCTPRTVIYTSMEILPGSTVANTLMNLAEESPFLQTLRELKVTYDDLIQSDTAPALGNGGLGRLTACIGESAATQNVPMIVSVPRHTQGLFRQKLENGRQVEVPDQWLNEDGTYFFEFPRQEYAQWVSFRDDCGGFVKVKMVPCLIPMIGATGGCTTIYAWKVGTVLAPVAANRERYLRIDRQLYCEDSDDEGKKVRLVQESALSQATVRLAIQKCYEQGKTVMDLPELFCLHINDTHASLMIPELIRILLDEYLVGRDDAWDVAWDIATRTFVYTNHTIMKEALEKWPLWMLQQLMPRTCQIIVEIDRRMVERMEREVQANPSGLNPPLSREELDSMRIIADGRVHMAHMDIFTACSVNGVARLHTDILKERELKAFHRLMSTKICNVTNGVTHRKFLVFANPEERKFITDCLKQEDWIEDMTRLETLLPFAEEEQARQDFLKMRKARKEVLAQYVKETRGIALPVDFIFDVQVKRFHMYKRQLLNCLRIIDLYLSLKKDPALDITPTAFILAGKAAAGYRQAKLVIELVLTLEKLINDDPEVNGKIRVCFIENYNVSNAMKIFPATDISEQISTASTEASGTSNMKFMLSGAITLGTLDGANVEIHEAVGDESMYLFGLRSEEVMAYQAKPGSYDPRKLYESNARLRRAVDTLIDGTLLREMPAPGESDRFEELYHELLYGLDGNPADQYFVLADFESYREAFLRMNHDYRDSSKWTRNAIRNIALSGFFSSDRTVKDYCEKVWKISFGNQ